MNQSNQHKRGDALARISSTPIVEIIAANGPMLIFPCGETVSEQCDAPGLMGGNLDKITNSAGCHILASAHDHDNRRYYLKSTRRTLREIHPEGEGSLIVRCIVCCICYNDSVGISRRCHHGSINR